MSKNIKTIICAAFSCAIVMSCTAAASADTNISVPIRVEGIDGNIYNETVQIEGDKVTAADALIYADEKSDKLEIKGADTGYISEINGVAAGKFGGYDGWYYCVNGEAPSVGVGDYELKDGDILTVYYGGFPCQIPYVDDAKLGDGILVFKSNDVEYDENWNATNVVNFVVDADVTVNGTSYKTDKNGEVKLDENTESGELSVQIDKKDETGAPCALRFAPDFTVTYNKTVESDTDSAADTESEKDTDTDTASDTDKKADSDKDSDDDESSSAASSSKTSSVSNNTTTAARTTTTTTTAAPAMTATATQNEAAAATGDGRIYAALSVFAVAAIAVIVLFALGRRDKD